LKQSEHKTLHVGACCVSAKAHIHILNVKVGFENPVEGRRCVEPIRPLASTVFMWQSFHVQEEADGLVVSTELPLQI
jgi:hypothetical protein